VKSGGEFGGSLGGGFIEHHDLHFFVVDAHTTVLCPVLAGVDHRLGLRGRSGYEYHVVNIEEGSNSSEVVNGGDLREFKEWKFGSQFEDKFRYTDVKNFYLIFLVNKGMENSYTYTSRVFFQ